MEQDIGSFALLKQIVARLRAPDGCPWDRRQTHASTKSYFIEEAYEVLQALDEEDATKLCEELGDLLFQVVLQAQIATEAGEFEMPQVLRGINSKLIRRHPHVFGEVRVKDEKEVALNWERIKQEERGEEASILSSLPQAMPALARSQALQQRAARVGFDWKEFEGILDKLTEEVEELKKAKNQRQRAEEFGDILFVLANAARWLDVDAEQALRLANERFCRRFSYMEELCRSKGISISDLPLEKLDELWEEAKNRGERI